MRRCAIGCIASLTQSIIFLILVPFLFSCKEEGKQQQVFSGQARKNNYASYFKITAQSTYTLLTNYLDQQKKDSVVYVLYKEKKPEIKEDVFFVKVPVMKVATLSASFVGLINRLDEVNKITAVDNCSFLFNPILNENFHSGRVLELAKNATLNIEMAVQSGVQVIFMNPGGDKRKDLDKRLLEAGVIPVLCGDYFEDHPLGRAEWIKAMAVFFDKEKSAEQLYTQTEKAYLAIKESVDTCKVRPTVLTEIKTGDTWFVAGGKSFIGILLQDAGATYCWKENGKREVSAMNMEQVIGKALNCDYWINLHLCNSKEDLLKMDERYGEFAAFKAGKLYNNTAMLRASGGNPYWEEGLCNPDELLSDLVAIFHPAILPSYSLKYYKALK